MSPITGIFGDHLKAVAARDGLDVADAADMELAGVVLVARLLRPRQGTAYPVTLLCGGARIPFDLTGLVGADLHATINWKTFAEVLADPRRSAVASTTRSTERPSDASRTRSSTCAGPWRSTGSAVEEFEAFGPVQHFRNNFIAGWHQVIDAVRQERAALVR